MLSFILTSITSFNVFVNFCRCVPGDAVLVVWNDTHQNYVILQESSTLFFVHSDSLEPLGLSLRAGTLFYLSINLKFVNWYYYYFVHLYLTFSEEGKRKIYSTAEVIEKEYCHARKVSIIKMLEKTSMFKRF